MLLLNFEVLRVSESLTPVQGENSQDIGKSMEGPKFVLFVFYRLRLKVFWERKGEGSISGEEWGRFIS